MVARAKGVQVPLPPTEAGWPRPAGQHTARHDRGSVHEGGLPERGDMVGTCDTARVVLMLRSYIPSITMTKFEFKLRNPEQYVRK